MFVGVVDSGRIFHFDLNDNRNDSTITNNKVIIILLLKPTNI